MLIFGSLIWTTTQGAAPPAVRSIFVILTDIDNNALPNLTGLRVAWWDEPVLNLQGDPDQTWTGQTTGVGGILSVTTVTGSALSIGGIGWIEISDSDGTITQSPVGNVAAGPIVVF